VTPVERAALAWLGVLISALVWGAVDERGQSAGVLLLIGATVVFFAARGGKL
jgi:hypothetical protein